MNKIKTIIYMAIMTLTFIGEAAFVIAALVSVNYLLFIGAGIFFLIQSVAGAYMLYEAAFKFHSESAYATMAFGMMIPFVQPMSMYFLYRVRKGE